MKVAYNVRYLAAATAMRNYLSGRINFVNEELKLWWIVALQRKDYKPGNAARVCSIFTYTPWVCSLHFSEGRPTLNNKSPTLDLGHNKKQSVSVISYKVIKILIMEHVSNGF
ncbi:hypothetical protein CHUAL_009618 [Chamberlinius hualienensis]